MRALIMAGGAGSRLGRGEKPISLICGRPMISYITDAFRAAGCQPVVVVSRKTPMTANWCRAQDIAIIPTGGDGFIGDMEHAVRTLQEDAPLIISVADIPCITSAIVMKILHSYHECGKDALSAWVPAYRVKSCRGSMPYHEDIGGIDSCPAGVNILRGDRIGAEQEEFALLLDEPQLAMNVNTREDLERAERFLRRDPAG